MIAISIVLATFQRDKLLARALDSLATQTFQDFEIVLVDDNTEPSWNQRAAAIAAAYQAAHPAQRLRLIANTGDHGSAGARNAGVLAAEGEYVTFLDDDDVYLPQKLGRQYAAMRQANADFSLTDLVLYREDDKPVDRRVHSYLLEAKPEDLLKLHLLHHLTGTDTIMMRRDYLLRIGLFGCINIGDEFYLMEKAIRAGGRFVYVPHCDVKAYVHELDCGLSAGKLKIEGENDLYAFKKQYFSILSRPVCRRIIMRHYAVLTYTYLRMKMPGKALLCAVRSAGASPLGLLQLLRGRKP